MHSGLYAGRVRHRRHAPRPHAFSYSVLLLYLDLAECETVFQGRWFWSAKRRALAWFRREDHFGPPDVPLDEWVRSYVANQTGLRPSGPIRILTQPRVAGFVFNPISVFHCFDAADTRVEVVVAEVGNTPWGQRHCYVLGRPGEPLSGSHRFRKTFHVSPFLAMDYEYLWRSRVAGNSLTIHMENHPIPAAVEPAAAGTLPPAPHVFDATLSLRRIEIGTASLAWALLRYPLMPLRVVAAIYWQALWLWLKKIPYVPHPGPQAAGNGGTFPTGQCQPP